MEDPNPLTPRSPSPDLHQRPCNRDYGLDPSDRRFSFSRQLSSCHIAPRSLQRNHSSVSVPSDAFVHLYGDKGRGGKGDLWELDGRSGFLLVLSALSRAVVSGSRPMRRLALLIALNVAYSTTELAIGIFTGRIGLVSDAFHLQFGCGLLTFSLLAMVIARRKPDEAYTYGYKRVEVLSAFTNAIFLLFMSFSLAVEALHAFIQEESEHKHYLIVSAVTNLLVNLLGFWFFRNYARINIAYRTAEDMNLHSVCLHLLADSVRSAGIVLASWFLTLGVKNAEVLCLGLVSVAIFAIVMPLFRASGGILLQMAPASVPTSAFSKCWRQITSLEDISEVTNGRFWELVPGQVIGSLSLQVKGGAEEYPILHRVHGLYGDLGIQELTVQTATLEN